MSKPAATNHVLDRAGVERALLVLSGHDPYWKFTGLTGDLWLTFLALWSGKKKVKR